MNFSDFWQSNGLASFSPNGSKLVHCKGTTLMIIDVQKLQCEEIINLKEDKMKDIPQKIEWGRDNEHILCVFRKRSFVRVINIKDKSFECKISNGVAGVSHACLSPDCSSLLVWCNHNLRITIFSLIGKPLGVVGVIKTPKFSRKGYDFTPDGKYFAIAERKSCKDYVNIIVTDTWELVKQFRVETKNLSDLKWSENGRLITCWDDMTEYLVCIMAPDGSLVKKFSAYEDALGIRSLKWCPNSQLLAIGSYDEKVRVLSKLTWKVLAELKHAKRVEHGNTLVFTEVEYGNAFETTFLSSNTAKNNTKYMVQELPVQLKKLKANYSKPNPKRGISIVEWSHDGKYFFTKSESVPNVLWIWQTARLALASLVIQTKPIKHAVWDPNHTRLALCTGTGRIYFWSESGHVNSTCVDIPNADFRVNKMKWSESGDSLVLMDIDKISICFPIWKEDEDEDEDEHQQNEDEKDGEDDDDEEEEEVIGENF